MDGTNNNFQVIVKNFPTFDGKNTVDFIMWQEKIRVRLNVYDKAVFRVLLGESQPPAATTGNNNAPNCVLFGKRLINISTASSFLPQRECSIVGRFAGKTLGDGSGHGQRA